MKIHRLLLAAFLLLLCLTAAGCGNTAFSVTMPECYGLTEPVDVTVSIKGSTYDALLFRINGVEYTVSGAPTVSDPAYRLSTAEDDGMTEIFLTLNPDEASRSAELHMLPEDDVERVYLLPIAAFQPLINWADTN